MQEYDLYLLAFGVNIAAGIAICLSLGIVQIGHIKTSILLTFIAAMLIIAGVLISDKRNHLLDVKYLDEQILIE